MDGMSITDRQAAPAGDTVMGAPAKQVARALGWFSIALGVAELIKPRAVTQPIGMDDHNALIRSYGLREIGAGVGILTSADPTPWVWGRVAGDALDIATVAGGLAGPRKGSTLAALLGLGGIMVVDALCAAHLADQRTS
jgi:hypothetical protein